jgi:hypothetical protein
MDYDHSTLDNYKLFGEIWEEVYEFLNEKEEVILDQ